MPAAWPGIGASDQLVPPSVETDRYTSPWSRVGSVGLGLRSEITYSAPRRRQPDRSMSMAGPLRRWPFSPNRPLVPSGRPAGENDRIDLSRASEAPAPVSSWNTRTSFRPSRETAFAIR